MSIKNNILYIQYNSLLNNKEFRKSNNIITFSFLGPIGSYSHLATLYYIKKHLKNNTDIIINIICNNFIEIFHTLKLKVAHYSIVPLINNYTGIIKDVYTLIQKNSVKIFFYFDMPINHCLISNNNNLILNNITTIISHPQPLKQCSMFIKKYSWNIKYSSSSSYALQYISFCNTNSNLAAISNKIAAKFYNLYVIKHNISNIINNKTRFIVINSP
ncbi:prephenate dehydratase domain-containing protein [Enterobacteriaceae endosymbiont of Neohaemonia nigricornis]|uniref:prephenate dehydratase domain-containing protein n=1 Tax=Enterobacteriaceae endosymbiont of Neohaemonia nigricornis TaxID=2675792 RepID=UPI001449D36E|nr:prephenate dehydratase domain-containing protein [Enterobacteriaceae endosymbiont of Neohaemonia nigricornis]QJC30637.1 hypothetical protein GJT85_02285 [Enterobacteriaceae endosymbiont of Neohaemonia nigricornis]